MPSIRYSDKWILVKLETTYGTDPVPATSNGVRAMNLSRSVYDGNTVERVFDRADMGSYFSINTSPFTTVSFDVEWSPAAEAAGAPAYDALLKACGLTASDETAESDATAWANATEYDHGDTASKSSKNYVAVQGSTGSDPENTPLEWNEYDKLPALKAYKPADSGHSSVTIHYYHGLNNRQVLTGCRGTAVFNLRRNELPTISFTFTGLYNKPVSRASNQVTATISQYQAPQPLTQTNTPIYRVGPYKPKSSELSIDLGNQIAYRDLTNEREVLITDRKMSFSTVVTADDIVSLDLYSRLESHLGKQYPNLLELGHGSGSRKIYALTDSAQITSLSEQESDMLKEYSIGGIFTPDGENEFTLGYA